MAGPRNGKRTLKDISRAFGAAPSWLLLVLLAPPTLCAGADPTQLDTAFADLYNFNFPAAQQEVDEYIAQHPQEPLPFAVRASGYLFYELDRLRILESEFLIDDNKIVDKKVRTP